MARVVTAFLLHCQLAANSSVGKLHKYVADPNFLAQSVKARSCTHGVCGECIEALEGKHAHVFFADLDSDGDLDMVGALGTHERNANYLSSNKEQQDFLVYLKNTGSRTAPKLEYQEGFFNSVMSGRSVDNKYDGWLPFLSDFDHDGDLDLLYTVKKLRPGYFYIHKNEGSPTLPSFAGTAQKFRVKECDCIMGMDVADINGDGSPDLVLGCDLNCGSGGSASVVIVMNPTLPLHNVLISGDTHKVLKFSLTGIGAYAYISPATIDIGKFSRGTYSERQVRYSCVIYSRVHSMFYDIDSVFAYLTLYLFLSLPLSFFICLLCLIHVQILMGIWIL
jgi:hypothetical protein